VGLIYVLDYDYVELTEAVPKEIVPMATLSAEHLKGKAVLRGKLTGKISKAEGPANVRFLGGIAAPNWQRSTVYAIGQMVTHGGEDDLVPYGGAQYRCTAAGTSASSGGPTGTGSSITDNGVTWEYVRHAPLLLDTHDLVMREGEYVDAPWMLEFEIHMRESRRTGVATRQYHRTAVVSGRLESPVLPEPVLLPIEGAYAAILDLADVSQFHVLYHPERDTGSLTCLTYVLEAL